MQNINETKSWFFGKISQIDKSLARQTENKYRVKSQITKIKNESGDLIGQQK